MNFENWYSELISNHIWFEPASLHHRPETFEKAARKVYMQCVADGVFKPMQECRKHVYNILAQVPGDKPKGKPWYEQALEKKIQEDAAKEEWKPVSEEERGKRLKEWKELIDECQMVSAVPKLTTKQIIEEGNWRAVPIEAPKDDFERRELIAEHLRKLSAAREKAFREHYPGATDEDVKRYLKKFKVKF